MAKNKMSDLRDHLFETLEALKDDEKPMDLDRARAIRDVAQTIINSAKVEVELVQAMDGTVEPDEFFELQGRRELGDGRPEVLRRKRLA